MAMNDLFKMLPEKDISLIEVMRDIACDHDSMFARRTDKCPTEYFLRFWNSNKRSNDMITKMFQDNPILSKPVKFFESKEELNSKAFNVSESGGYRYLRDAIRNLIMDYNTDWDVRCITDADGLTNPSVWFEDDTQFSLSDIFNYYFFDTESIITNTFKGPTCSFKIAEDKSFTLNKGAKFGRTLGRLAKAAIANYVNMGLESKAATTELYLNRVINDCSMVRNTAAIETTLCLSIHPMDYFTASYNDNCWRSCMNWEDGEYRRGVIEMMNSPYVVVAYTKSHEDMNICGYNWNSKKWREFIIVHPRYGIFGIKGYPYWNESLESAAINWIADLLPDYKFNELKHFKYGEGIEELKFLCMDCGPAMYNDFYGNNEYAYRFLAGAGHIESILHIFYSGQSECLMCGDENEFGNESNVLCFSCCDVHTCENCGENIYDEEGLIIIDGHEFCSSCVDEFPYCDICNRPQLPVDYPESDTVDIALGYSPNHYLRTYCSERPRRFCVCRSCLESHLINPVPGDITEKYPTYTSLRDWAVVIPPEDFTPSTWGWSLDDADKKELAEVKKEFLNDNTDEIAS